MKSRKDEHWSTANAEIREHQRAGLTTNAKVCRQAETSVCTEVFLRNRRRKYADHIETARRLYEHAGYTETDISMSKEL
ncbi:hypothetical protein [Bacillus atrophaeus]|uniref:hypothetical protein n=1 Tax=Bacillus atrophaeus TaxID=1452 RepID=UPI001EFA5D34|nr:hypothetical protein [Bacillus atrophaeus]